MALATSPSRRLQSFRRIENDTLGCRLSDKAVTPETGYFLTRKAVITSKGPNCWREFPIRYRPKAGIALL
jgi:hypothetical protein